MCPYQPFGHCLSSASALHSRHTRLATFIGFSMTANWTAAGTSTATITGWVGIGTTAPRSLLELYGSNAKMIMGGPSGQHTYSLEFMTADTTEYTWNYTNTSQVGGEQAGFDLYRTVKFEKASGKTGFGTMIPPAYLSAATTSYTDLFWVGQDTTTALLKVSTTTGVSITGAGSGGFSYTNVSSPTASFSLGTTTVTISSSGLNIPLVTEPPQPESGLLSLYANSATGGFSFKNAAADVFNISTGTASSQWTTNGSSIGFTGGNVGIGTTAPLYPLHVVGTPSLYTTGNAGFGTTPGTSRIQASISSNSDYAAILTNTHSSGSALRTVVASGGASDTPAIIESLRGTTQVWKVQQNGSIKIGPGNASVPVHVSSGGVLLDGTSTYYGSTMVTTTPTINASIGYIWAFNEGDSAEVKVMDGAGNATKISPHNPLTGEWVFYSENVNTGRRVQVNMEQLIYAVEELTGKKFLYENKPLRTK